MSFTSQNLQQIKALLSEKIGDLEFEREAFKNLIDDWVIYKKPFVVSGEKGIVDQINETIRNEYKEVEKRDKKLKKLRELQKVVKDELVEQTNAARKPVHTWEDHVSNEFAPTNHEGYIKRVPIILNEPHPPLQTLTMTHPPITGIQSATLPYITTNTSNDTTAKPSNPKDMIGSGKLPIHLWPNTATAMGCIGFLNGMLKYGRSNFRAIGIRASIYYDAAKRHLDAWFEGEEVDPDDEVPHLAAALACIAIIVDADAAGVLNDDRAYPGGYRALVERLTPLVGHLKSHHEGKNPHHYTIADVK
jgi:polyhydroxyalkanoate synthesis regulator phasin